MGVKAIAQKTVRMKGNKMKTRHLKFLFLCISISTTNSFAADKLRKPDGYVGVYNACTQPIWLWTTWTSENKNVSGRNKPRMYHRLDKIEPGKEFDFGGNKTISAQWPVNGTMEVFNPNLNSWNGISSLRIVPKGDCDKLGSNCNVGESTLTVPEINDTSYDHFYYAPEGLYTSTILENVSMIEFLKTIPNNLSLEQKRAAKDKMRSALYSAGSFFPQPNIESSFEATFKCKNTNTAGSEDEICQTTVSQLPLTDGNYYNISFVNGFTFPVYVKAYQNTADDLSFQDQENSAACTDIDGSNHMPIASAIEKFIPKEIALRGNRPRFSDVCTMSGVTLKSGFFQNQLKYNFEHLNAEVINPKNNETIGCASPKSRLLFRDNKEKNWLKKHEVLLENLYSENDNDSQEYDSRVIPFSCPYVQENLTAFQKTKCGNFQCESGECIPNPSLCSKTFASKSNESNYLTEYDSNTDRYGAYLPFKSLIDKNLNNPAFRGADRRGQNANDLCHGPIMNDGTYKGSEYPIENTGWVKSLRTNTTNIQTYTFDDAAGTRRCNSSKSSLVYVLCGDETFIKNQL